MCENHHSGAPLPRHRITVSRAVKVNVGKFSSEDAFVSISSELYSPKCKEEQARILGDLEHEGMTVIIEAMEAKTTAEIGTIADAIRDRHGMKPHSDLEDEHPTDEEIEAMEAEARKEPPPPPPKKKAPKRAPKQAALDGPADGDDAPIEAGMKTEIRELAMKPDPGPGALVKALIRKFTDVKPGKEGDGINRLTRIQGQRILGSAYEKHPELQENGFKNGSDVLAEQSIPEPEPVPLEESIDPELAAKVKKIEKRQEATRERNGKAQTSCEHIWFYDDGAKLSKCLTCGIEGTPEEYRRQKVAEFISGDPKKAEVFDWIREKQKAGANLYEQADDLADVFGVDVDVARAALREYIAEFFDEHAEPEPADVPILLEENLNSMGITGLRAVAKERGIHWKNPETGKAWRKTELVAEILRVQEEA